jgi:NAD(P)-dependent dehydrogenase (short-subunit alcohol dehydrogenase family)
MKHELRHSWCHRTDRECGDGVRINAICPGTINTPMVSDMLEKQADAMKEIMRDQPIGRLGESEEIAAAVLWLCSSGASFVVGVALRRQLAERKT